jgi:hypothetical protein
VVGDVAGKNDLKLSRRRFLRGAGATALATGATPLLAPRAAAARALRARAAGLPLLRAHPVLARAGEVRRFHSEPDLGVPAVAVAANSRALSGGYVMLGLQALRGSHPGVMLIGGVNELTYYGTQPRWPSNVAAWEYAGQRVLAYWDGRIVKPGYGVGEATLLNEAYERVTTIRAANGLDMDLHELRITPQGTALFTCFPVTVEADLRPVGGPRSGQVLESVFQEVDISSGRLLMEWRSLDHIPIADSYLPFTHQPYDYLHLNSVSLTPDNHLLVSGRHTWALYKLDRNSGEVIWRLGGKSSNWRLSPEARFSWQHDSSQPFEKTITVFDDGAAPPIFTERNSRGLVLGLNPRSREVVAASVYLHPGAHVLAGAMGSVQLLPDEQVIVGWGFGPYATQYHHNGPALADYRLPEGQISYRAMRLPWQGHPTWAPQIASTTDARTGQSVLYASWNGSTETAFWQVNAGTSASSLAPAAIAPNRGFETAIQLGSASGYVSVTALDRAHRPLATSAPLHL